MFYMMQYSTHRNNILLTMSELRGPDLVEESSTSSQSWRKSGTYMWNKYLKDKNRLKKQSRIKRETFCKKCYELHLKKDPCKYDTILEMENLDDTEWSGIYCETCLTFVPKDHCCNLIGTSKNLSCTKMKLPFYPF